MEIEIRHAKPEDYQDIHVLFSQPGAYSGTLQLPYPSPVTWKTRLENPPKDSVSLVACVNGELVGSIGLFQAPQVRRRHTAGIGMGVHDNWQRQGVGRKLLAAVIDLADNWYSLVRLELTVFVDNDAAINLYKSSGFEVEGTLRCFAFRHGKYVDVYSMARINHVQV